MKDRTKLEKVKAAVRDNFDASPEAYDAFEQNHGFFRLLTRTLLGKMTLPADARILDIGCGTGASTAEILELVPGGQAWGLDLSAGMLRSARQTYGDDPRMTFVEGDAARLTDCLTEEFDAILYSASLFLIPDYQESLSQALRILKPQGCVGVSFLDGLYDAQGNNLIRTADAKAQVGVNTRKPVDMAEFRSFFSGLLSPNHRWIEDFACARETLRAFYSVPAMSAGLFPGIPYEARVEKVGCLFDALEDSTVLFRWELVTGCRS
jgi:ubiquinone/menaquinone biosynthesis C-methylase UbiE